MNIKQRFMKYLTKNVVGLNRKPSALMVDEEYLTEGNSGRRGVYPASRVKVNTMFDPIAEALGHPAWLSNLEKSCSFTPPELLPLWSDADEVEPLPPTLDAPFSCMLNSHGDNIYTTEWVLLFEDGRVEVWRPTPTMGWSNDGEVTRYIKAQADDMPVGVSAAIKIIQGSCSDGDGIYGSLWYLYKNK